MHHSRRMQPYFTESDIPSWNGVLPAEADQRYQVVMIELAMQPEKMTLNQILRGTTVRASRCCCALARWCNRMGRHERVGRAERTFTGEQDAAWAAQLQQPIDGFAAARRLEPGTGGGAAVRPFTVARRCAAAAEAGQARA